MNALASAITDYVNSLRIGPGLEPLTDCYAGPFGSMKMSGHARELGEEGLESFFKTKHVHWDFDDSVKPYRCLWKSWCG